MKIRSIFLALAAALCFLLAVLHLEQDRQAKGLRQLEDTLRRTAVSCYAAEGFYPPSVAYMQEHYALQWDHARYTVHYERFASNLMPDITVLEN